MSVPFSAVRSALLISILACFAFPRTALPESAVPAVLPLPGNIERSLVRIKLRDSGRYCTGVVLSNEFMVTNSRCLGQVLEPRPCYSQGGASTRFVDSSYGYYLPKIEEGAPVGSYCSDATCSSSGSISLTKYYHRLRTGGVPSSAPTIPPADAPVQTDPSGVSRYNYNALKTRNQRCVYRNLPPAQTPGFAAPDLVTDVPETLTIERFAADFAELPVNQQASGMLVFVRYQNNSGRPLQPLPIWNGRVGLEEDNFFVAGYGRTTGNGILGVARNNDPVGYNGYTNGDYDPAFGVIRNTFYLLGFAEHNGSAFRLIENRFANDSVVFSYRFVENALICAGPLQVRTSIGIATSCNGGTGGYFGNSQPFFPGIPFSYRATVVDGADYVGTSASISGETPLSSASFRARTDIFNLHGAPDFPKEVKKLYRLVVGRVPTTSELSYQVQRLTDPNPSLRTTLATLKEQLAGQEESIRFYYRDVVGREITGLASQPNSELGTVQGWYTTGRFSSSSVPVANYGSITQRLGDALESNQALHRKLTGRQPDAAQESSLRALGGNYEQRKNRRAAQDDAIEYLYLTITGRKPIPEETTKIKTMLASSKTYEEVRNFVAASAESISYLYRTLAGRYPTTAEVDDAIRKLQDEWDYIYLKNQVAKSDEAITYLYRTIAFRNPSASERSALRTEYDRGRNHLDLKNALARNSIAAFYVNVVGRDAGASEIATVQSWYDSQRRNYDLDISLILASATESVKFFYRTVVGREVSGASTACDLPQPKSELTTVQCWYISRQVPSYEAMKDHLGNAEESIQKLYRQQIGRNPSAAEVIAVRQLGLTYEQRKTALARTEKAITYLYQTVLGRSPIGADCFEGERKEICDLYDPGREDGGQSYENVRNFVAAKPEAIGYLYRMVAGRNPTRAEVSELQSSFLNNGNYLYRKNVLASSPGSVRHLYRTVAFREATAAEVAATSAAYVTGERVLYEDVKNELASRESSIHAFYRNVVGRPEGCYPSDLAAIRGWYVNERRSYDWDIRQKLAASSEAILNLYASVGGLSAGGTTPLQDRTVAAESVACPANSYRDQTPTKTYCVFKTTNPDDVFQIIQDLKSQDYDDAIKRRIAVNGGVRRLLTLQRITSISSNQIRDIQSYIQREGDGLGRSYEHLRYCLGKQSSSFDMPAFETCMAP